MNGVSNVPAGQVMGEKNGTLTVVEFLDYRCPFCRDIHPTITEAVERDQNIRYIVRPVVFVDPLSEVTARAAYAAVEQDKFEQFHNALIALPNDPTEAAIQNIVREIGGDWQMFNADMESESAKDFVIDNVLAFRAIGGSQTPTFIIGHKMEYIPKDRMPDVLDFMRMFEEARQLGLK